jgi:ribosome recycling factor
MLEKLVRETSHHMKQSVEATAKEFATIRTGRANPALLDRIEVQAYGSALPLNQVATISAPEPRLLVIAPWDKSLVAEIRKAITSSDLGLNPVVDGAVLKVPLPQLTEERRQEMAKLVARKTEEGKVAVRNIRRDAIEELRRLEKAHEIGEDDLHRIRNQIQEVTDKHIEELDRLHDAKVKEIMEV